MILSPVFFQNNLLDEAELTKHSKRASMDKYLFSDIMKVMNQAVHTEMNEGEVSPFIAKGSGMLNTKDLSVVFNGKNTGTDTENKNDDMFMSFLFPGFDLKSLESSQNTVSELQMLLGTSDETGDVALDEEKLTSLLKDIFGAADGESRLFNEELQKVIDDIESGESFLLNVGSGEKIAQMKIEKNTTGERGENFILSLVNLIDSEQVDTEIKAVGNNNNFVLPKSFAVAGNSLFKIEAENENDTSEHLPVNKETVRNKNAFIPADKNVNTSEKSNTIVSDGSKPFTDESKMVFRNVKEALENLTPKQLKNSDIKIVINEAAGENVKIEIPVQSKNNNLIFTVKSEYEKELLQTEILKLEKLSPKEKSRTVKINSIADLFDPGVEKKTVDEDKAPFVKSETESKPHINYAAAIKSKIRNVLNGGSEKLHIDTKLSDDAKTNELTGGEMKKSSSDIATEIKTVKIDTADKTASVENEDHPIQVTAKKTAGNVGSDKTTKAEINDSAEEENVIKNTSKISDSIKTDPNLSTEEPKPLQDQKPVKEAVTALNRELKEILSQVTGTVEDEAGSEVKLINSEKWGEVKVTSKETADYTIRDIVIDAEKAETKEEIKQSIISKLGSGQETEKEVQLPDSTKETKLNHKSTKADKAPEQNVIIYNDDTEDTEKTIIKIYNDTEESEVKKAEPVRPEIVKIEIKAPVKSAAEVDPAEVRHVEMKENEHKAAVANAAAVKDGALTEKAEEHAAKTKAEDVRLEKELKTEENKNSDKQNGGEKQNSGNRDGGQDNGRNFNETFSNQQRVNASGPTAGAKAADAVKTVKYTEIIKEISSHILKKDESSLTLRIKPESLGELKVQLKNTDGMMRALIEVENPAVKQMIESNLGQLMSALNNSGVQMSSVQVSLNNNDTGNGKSEFGKKRTGNGGTEGVDENEERTSERKLGYNTYEYVI